MTEPLFTIDITEADKIRIRAGLALLSVIARSQGMDDENQNIIDLSEEVGDAAPLVETVATSKIADVLTERDRQIIAGALGFAAALVIRDPALADGVQGADYNELRDLSIKMDL